ncbi:MAG TPA: hypothetical protein VFV42_06390 [Acidimicrobiales bacterium]|nr:hypothetical protein [Acidimicrobiales bacterium]
MSGLLVLLLVAPAAAALAVSIVPDRSRAIASATVGAVGLGWAVVAGSSEPVTAGDLVADPLLAAASAGLAALALSSRTATATGAAAALLALTAVPGAAALDPARLPDRRYAAGVVVLGVLAAARLLVERGPRPGQAVVLAASLLVAAGLVGEEAPAAVALAAAGTIVALAAAAVWGPPGRLLVPAGLLALARVVPRRAPDPDVDLVLLVVAAGVAAGAAALFLVRERPVAHRLPLGGALAAVGLLALDVPELRAAGALLGAGAVLALAGRHPLALLALVPGVVAAVQAAGVATAPEQAAVGAAAVAALAAGSCGRLGPARRDDVSALTAVAVGFGLIPLWGWAGADTRAYGDAVAVAVGVALPLAVLAAGAGSIVRRPRADPTDGSTPVVEAPAEAQPQEAGAEAP